MNVTNLPYNDLLSCPLRLLLDDTAIVWGYRALENALFVTYGFLSRASFFRLNPYYEGRRYTKIWTLPFSFIFFGRNNAVRVSSALLAYKIYRCHFGKLPLLNAL